MSNIVIDLESKKIELAENYLQILNWYKASGVWRALDRRRARQLARNTFLTLLEIDGLSEKDNLHPVKMCFDITGRLVYKPYRSALKNRAK